MRAFILAAGLGTRLFPITKDKPKALAELQGKTLLQHTIERLKKEGIKEFAINIHHFGDKVLDHLLAKMNFGVQICISDERELLLDTGGALKKIGEKLPAEENLLVHNVDVITDLDTQELLKLHTGTNAIATLAVRKRDSSRQLVFDSVGLCGWKNLKTGEEKWAREPEGETTDFAFSGIHLINGRIFEQITEDGAFSVIDLYLRLAKTEVITPFDHSEGIWKDVGRISHLEEIEREWSKYEQVI